MAIVTCFSKCEQRRRWNANFYSLRPIFWFPKTISFSSSLSYWVCHFASIDTTKVTRKLTYFLLHRTIVAFNLGKLTTKSQKKTMTKLNWIRSIWSGKELSKWNFCFVSLCFFISFPSGLWSISCVVRDDFHLLLGWREEKKMVSACLNDCWQERGSET